MAKRAWSRRGIRPRSGDQTFDAAGEDWVSVAAKSFFFEPYCSELVAPGPGSVVVTFGEGDTRHRGVEVTLHEEGSAVVWVPIGGRVFWLPDLSPDDNASLSWEARLQPFDHERGLFTGR